jgi:protein gp37
MKNSGTILKTIGVLTLCGMALAARAAAVFDDFESYAVGSNLHGQGGWAGWAGDAKAGALVSTNFSFSPTRSVNITGASDLVHTFSGATNGQWVFSVMQYIPSTSTGTNFVILLNTYRSPYGAADLNWSVQIQNNMATGQIISDLGGGATRPMVKDQ